MLQNTISNSPLGFLPLFSVNEGKKKINVWQVGKGALLFSVQLPFKKKEIKKFPEILSDHTYVSIEVADKKMKISRYFLFEGSR